MDYFQDLNRHLKKENVFLDYLNNHIFNNMIQNNKATRGGGVFVEKMEILGEISGLADPEKVRQLGKCSSQFLFFLNS